jgi:nucleotide-binding universal stress UspA family protein
MYKKILIATDGSDLAGKALSHGLELAKKFDASVTIVTVTELWPPVEMAAQVQSGHAHPIEDFERNVAAWAEKILSAAADKARDAGVSCETVHLPDSHPADGIIETARKKDCGLIVMASHGYRGVKKILLGSVANEVLAHSSVPVLICR